MRLEITSPRAKPSGLCGRSGKADGARIERIAHADAACIPRGADGAAGRARPRKASEPIMPGAKREAFLVHPGDDGDVARRPLRLVPPTKVAASSAASTPDAPSNLPPVGWLSRWLPSEQRRQGAGPRPASGQEQVAGGIGGRLPARPSAAQPMTQPPRRDLALGQRLPAIRRRPPGRRPDLGQRHQTWPEAVGVDRSADRSSYRPHLVRMIWPAARARIARRPAPGLHHAR